MARTPTQTPADEAAEEFGTVDLTAEAKRIYAEELEENLDVEYPTPPEVGVVGTEFPGVSLHTKLAEVMGIVERIPKRGRAPAAMGGFPFVQVGDAAAAIRKELAARHITLMPISMEMVSENEHETGRGGIMTTQTLRVTWQFTDGDNGETFTIQSFGTGADRGDKASPKAQTNAMKYALLMAFLMPTGDDPELEDSSDRHGPQPNPVIEETTGNTGEVQVGGRQGKASQAQVMEIGRFAKRLKLGSSALAATINAALPSKPVPDYPLNSTGEDRTRIIVDYLEGLTHDEAATIVQTLMSAIQEEPDTR
jgi:hypothetical protein